MEVHHIKPELTGIRSSLVTDYMEGHPALRAFYTHVPGLNAVQAAASIRVERPIDRELLTAVLLEQHAAFLDSCPVVQKNIQSLSDPNTFTVTTGHQLCMAGGPLFLVYKLISCINSATAFERELPGRKVVPVFWMASEDHDVAEMDHVNLGADVVRFPFEPAACTGRLKSTAWEEEWVRIGNMLQGTAGASEVLKVLRSCYMEGRSIADYMRSLVLQLFGKSGLIVIDADDARLKKAFIPVMRNELSAGDYARVVRETTERLGAHTKVQAMVRDLNLFYLTSDSRVRIERDMQGLRLSDSSEVRSHADWISELEQYPERFSPNVLLRPVYQELILPNLGVVLGPGELAYWLQLKEGFELQGVGFPILIPRNQGLLISQKNLAKFSRMGFSLEEIFLKSEELVQRWLLQNTNIDAPFDSAQDTVTELFTHLVQLAQGVDPTLESSVRAEEQRVKNGLDQLRKKLTAALKRRHETIVNQIQRHVSLVSPNAIPQERSDNVFWHYTRTGPELMDILMDSMKPFQSELVLVVYPEQNPARADD
ncbi:MAG: bacillithiol biosynthesis cysteine-adding enzyme BshC [Bacteroidota bacterium]